MDILKWADKEIRKKGEFHPRKVAIQVPTRTKFKEMLLALLPEKYLEFKKKDPNRPQHALSYKGYWFVYREK